MTELAALGVLILGAGAAALWLYRRGRAASDHDGQREREVADFQQEAAALKLGMVELRGQVKSEMGELQLSVARELRDVGAEVARQLHDGMKLIHSGQSSVGERLDHAARVVGEVQGSLGKLQEATQRVAEVGREIQGLEQILKSPKIRGGLGETLLEQLLAQMLPREHYHLQHGFKSGEKVDAAIVISGRLVPVDAKFPLENFRRLMTEPDEERRRQSRKAFARDVKNRVEEIAKKYIVPDEDTFDFALMYVPAENVYYEMIVKDDAAEDESIGAYALSRRVVPVSPNSLYAYLQVIILGLRGLRIEANARAIQNDLSRLTGDLEKVREHFTKLGGHLKNAQGQFTDADRHLTRFEDKLAAIERRGGQAELPGFEP
ncbi:MAG TPA: DNA recombination protein RmuC [Methylomirabilota bacterium]|jgi:DNA recombination protein RmuC|nr:DNA recombination protein RmuC [Methylomirabilota bacterium]